VLRYAIVSKSFVFLAKILKTFVHGLSGAAGHGFHLKIIIVLVLIRANPACPVIRGISVDFFSLFAAVGCGMN
jgi:hypothetical protein